jgi:hypothetical protein
MTIFRFSAAVLATFLSGCADNMPPSKVELGKIARTADFKTAQLELKAFAEKGLRDRSKLRAQFAAAGFRTSSYWDDEMALNCESYHLTGKDWGDAFPHALLANICGNYVFTSAGALAP